MVHSVYFTNKVMWVFCFNNFTLSNPLKTENTTTNGLIDTDMICKYLQPYWKRWYRRSSHVIVFQNHQLFLSLTAHVTVCRLCVSTCFHNNYFINLLRIVNYYVHIWNRHWESIKMSTIKKEAYINSKPVRNVTIHG